jgi:hypothetical protein
MKRRLLLPLLILSLAVSARAEIKVTVDHNDNEHAKPEFKFDHVPSPSDKDAATKAKFSIVDGERDPNGGELEVLNDGKLPKEEDEPAANFFFNAGTEGGRLGIDLGSVIDIKQVNTYSWHPNTRGPQFYKLYASDGKAAGFNAAPKKGTNPETVGWTLVASVDTRPKEGDGGGQYGVSIADSDAKDTLGKYRYLLLDCFRTEADDGFGNTFFSEIDVVAADAARASAKELIGDPAAKGAGTVLVIAGDGKYRITIDYSDTPELEEWATKELAPVVKDWYPKLVDALPSEGYEAPKQFSVTFRKDAQGVAYTAGTRVVGAYAWFSKNLKGEGKGAIVHELVHVVQQYGQARRNNPNAQRNPGWLVEGIPDYLRWYKYEPESHGTEITKRNFARAKYDGSYRITANFLNYVIDKYDKNLIQQLNAAMRQGRYDEDLWKQYTGKTVQELGDEWKNGIAKSLGIEPAPAANAAADVQNKVHQENLALHEQNRALRAEVEAKVAAAADDSSTNVLTDDEKKAGWKLLFDGKSLDGWHTFKRKDVMPGWQVKDDTLACVDPHNAGDLCTNDQYSWFELQLDYNISEGGNSGIMYHVTDKGGAVWATGPEFQLEDNAKAADPIRCGWLYALYQPPIDPATGKPLDATKPVGQWNHVRLLLTPAKCVHEINGVKYFEYVLGSDDFNARVAKSKFSKMRDFAKSDTGYISLQGDHGQVSFRNVKVRPIETEKK